MADNISQSTKFNPIIIALHWFMLLLMVAVYAFMEFRGIFPKGSEPREFMKALNLLGGGVVFEAMDDARIDEFLDRCADRAREVARA